MISPPVSAAFKSAATKAVLGILLFIFVYIVVFLFMIILIAVSMIGGGYLVLAGDFVLVKSFGACLVLYSVVLLLFYIRLLFSSDKVQANQLCEITHSDEPEFFALVQEVVDEVGVSFPAKVVLSLEVNAGVRYASHIRSMFFPTRKELIVGLPLFSVLSKSELRALLAHEFAHFSQKSMVIGSYTGFVNKRVNSMIATRQRWVEDLDYADGSKIGFFFIFTKISMAFIEGGHDLMTAACKFMNKSHMSMNRESEYHADAVATLISSKVTAKQTLVKMSFADSVWQSCIDYLRQTERDYISAKDVLVFYREALFYHAAKCKFSIEDDVFSIPNYNLPVYGTKVEISSVWSSHPSLNERLNRIDELDGKETDRNETNIVLLRGHDKYSEALTDSVPDGSGDEIENNRAQQVFDAYVHYLEKGLKPEVFNRCYDNYFPTIKFEPKELQGISPLPLKELYTDSRREMQEEFQALHHDLMWLKALAENPSDEKGFTYDGQWQPIRKAVEVHRSLVPRYLELQAKLRKGDAIAYVSYCRADVEQDTPGVYAQLVQECLAWFDLIGEINELLSEFQEIFDFMSNRNWNHEIEKKMQELKELEASWKPLLLKLVAHKWLQEQMEAGMKEMLMEYINQDSIYYDGHNYLGSKVHLLTESANRVYELCYFHQSICENQLFDYMAKLATERVEAS